MSSKKNLYQTIVKVEILSDKVLQWVDADDFRAYMEDQDCIVGLTTIADSYRLSEPEMVERCHALQSDPEFFGLKDITFEDPMEMAYADVAPAKENESPEVLNQFRMLDWYDDRRISLDEAIEKFRKYCPEYNEFYYENLKCLKSLVKDIEDIEISCARENSVCIYVRGPGITEKSVKTIQVLLKADEISDDHNGFVRIWWD